MRGWKRYLFNFDTLIYLIIALVVIYHAVKYRGRKGIRFQGLGNNGWDISESHSFWNQRSPEFGKESRPPPKKKRVNKHEERCREIFESIYQKRFKSVRPSWLKNPVTKRNLELDGYCSDIRTPIGKGLAFEYDGAQHSEYNKHFHRSGVNEFKYQVTKDAYKDQRCKEEGVMLIRIPHFVAFEDLERYIRNKLKKKGLLPRGYVPGGSTNYRPIRKSYVPMTQSDEYEESRRQSTPSGFDISRYNWTPDKGGGFLNGLYD